jgi:hypothetical protein
MDAEAPPLSPRIDRANSSTVRLRPPQVLAPPSTVSVSSTRRIQWGFKQASFLLISLVVLSFAIAGVFTEKLSRDQGIGLIGVIVSANLPSPLLDLQKPKKKIYLGSPPVEATDTN